MCYFSPKLLGLEIAMNFLLTLLLIIYFSIYPGDAPIKIFGAVDR